MEAVGTFSCCSVPLTVREDLSCRRDWVSKISICCTVCGKKSSVTDPYRAEDVVVNSRAHLAMRTIGKARAGLATFSGMMGIAPPITSKHYGTYNQRLMGATDPVRERHDGHSSPHHIQALRDLQPETEGCYRSCERAA